MKFITESTGTEGIKNEWYSICLGISKFLKKIWLCGLCWFTLHDPTIHNTTMQNSCINYIGLFLFICHESCINYISFVACHKQTDDGGYSLYHIEKLKDFPEQFKSGLILFL